MKVLLDTHAFLWMLTDDRRLSRRARRVIANVSNHLYLSAASLWEIVLKVQARKLVIEGTVGGILKDQLSLNGIAPLPVGLKHVAQVEKLPLLHRDPFDRLLIAQAQVEDLVVLTKDAEIVRYSVETIW